MLVLTFTNLESNKSRMTTKQLLNKYYKKKKKSKQKVKRNRLKTFKSRYFDYLKSKKWAQIKLDLYESRGKQCEVCESKRNVQVHHLSYKNVFNEEPEDLILLCKNCHEKEHGIK